MTRWEKAGGQYREASPSSDQILCWRARNEREGGMHAASHQYESQVVAFDLNQESKTISRSLGRTSLLKLLANNCKTR